MLVLQCHRKFDEYCLFNHNTGEYKIYSKEECPDKFSEPTKGWFSIIENDIAALYEVNRKTWFRYKNINIEIDSSLKALMVNPKKWFISSKFCGNRILRLKKDNVTIDIEYKRPNITNIPFTMSSEDDFDFFLFVHNQII